MSNERIDLTQFENMEDNRPWSTSWYPAEEEVEPDFLIEGGAEGHKVRIVNTQGGITLAYIANGNEVLAKQIAKLPDLIAELKRCYEKLDKADEAMLTAREVLMKHYEWMSMNDATSEEDDQEILDVVKALREAS